MKPAPTDYNAEKREQARNSKEERIRRLMDKCPKPGKAVYDWITEQMVGDLQYAFYDKQKKTCHCTACGGDFPEEAAGVPVKHRKQIICPLCGHLLTVDKRADLLIVATDWLTMIHDVDDKQGVWERHFKVKVEWARYGTRTTELEEHIRLMMLRNTAKDIMKIYYMEHTDGAREITAAVGGTAPICIQTQKVFRPDYMERHMRHGQMYFRNLPRWE